MLVVHSFFLFVARMPIDEKSRCGKKRERRRRKRGEEKKREKEGEKGGKGGENCGCSRNGFSGNGGL